MLSKGLDSRLKMPSQTFPANLQPAMNNLKFDISHSKITEVLGTCYMDIKATFPEEERWKAAT